MREHRLCDGKRADWREPRRIEQRPFLVQYQFRLRCNDPCYGGIDRRKVAPSGAAPLFSRQPRHANRASPKCQCRRPCGVCRRSRRAGRQRLSIPSAGASRAARCNAAKLSSSLLSTQKKAPAKRAPDAFPRCGESSRWRRRFRSRSRYVFGSQRERAESFAVRCEDRIDHPGAARNRRLPDAPPQIRRNGMICTRPSSSR